MASIAPPTATHILILPLLVVLTHCVSIRGVAEAQMADVGSNVSLAAQEATLGWLAFTAEEDPGRVLYGRKASHRGYYISYAALAANYIPCPPRSGRSYYTNNCYRAGSSVNPYSREDALVSLIVVRVDNTK